jgi:hypothetical protein
MMPRLTHALIVSLLLAFLHLTASQAHAEPPSSGTSASIRGDDDQGHSTPVCRDGGDRGPSAGLARPSGADGCGAGSSDRSANFSGLPWKSGVSPGTVNGDEAIEKISGFAEWRGRPVDIAAIFMGKEAWAKGYERYLTHEVLAPKGALAALKKAGIIPLLTVPLVTKADAGKFAYVASGAIDKEHQAVADKIKSVVGNGTIYLRLGHEADSGFPWSYTNHDGDEPDPADPADYKAAWARIARIYDQTLPGAKMVWNVLKNTRLRVTDYYPGDDVVDVISIDVYDNGSGGYCDAPDAKGWKRTCLGSYEASTGISKGVEGILALAKSRGKKIGIDEWGASNKKLSISDGANNGHFVAGMYDFFAANSADIEYEAYFNRAGGGKHQIWPKTDYNPLPSDAYLSRWKRQDVWTKSVHSLEDSSSCNRHPDILQARHSPGKSGCPF